MPNSMNDGLCDVSCILQETTKLLPQEISYLTFQEAVNKNFCCSMSLPNFLEFGHLIASYIIHVMVVSF